MTDYPYLPPECRQGHCDHAPDRCMRYRSRRCESGECRHASQNLLCAVNYPTTGSEATRWAVPAAESTGAGMPSRPVPASVTRGSSPASSRSGTACAPAEAYASYLKHAPAIERTSP